MVFDFLTHPTGLTVNGPLVFILMGVPPASLQKIPARRPWTKEELAALWKEPDRVLAARCKRTETAVGCLRLLTTCVLGGTASLMEGARVRVVDLDGPKPLNVIFQPLRREEVQLSEHFDGFESWNLRLMLRTVRTRCCVDKKAVYFSETFRLVEDVV